MRPRTAHRAFTLIEMLVSLAIVGTIVTMVYGSYAATSRSVEVYTSRMACSERAQLALRMMARQIRCAYAPLNPTAAFRAETRNLRGDLLSFTTTGGFGLGLDEPAGISRVAYRYDDRAKVLSICSEPGVRRPEELRDSGTWRPMLTGVTSVELGFYDGRNWQPRWDTKPGGKLPQAVKIALSVAEKNGREHRYATTVPIVCQKAAQVQQVQKPGGRS
ncbi:MAG: GspJ family type II secretion system protein [Phycisphaerales bacterium]